MKLNGLHFLVMDYVEGIDAAQLLFRQEKLSVPVSCEIVRQAALGLDFAHSKSLIHRDVKPSNLLVAASGQVKLLDLGVATRIEESPSGTITDKAIVGTLSYMSPEQRSGSSNLDARADIYGLGKTLLKLLAGRNVSSSELGIDELHNDVPADVQSLLSRMVATNPDDRPATAKEVAKALSPHADQRDLIDLVNKLFPNRDGSVAQSIEFPAPASSSVVAKRSQEAMDRCGNWAINRRGVGCCLVPVDRHSKLKAFTSQTQSKRSCYLRQTLLNRVDTSRIEIRSNGSSSLPNQADARVRLYD